MNNKEIQSLLLRYRNGDCSKEEIARIHLWYDKLNKESLLSLGESEREATGDRILQNIRSEINAEKYHQQTIIKKWWRSGTTYASAAAVIIAIGCWVFLGKASSREVIHKEKILVQAPAGQLITHINSSDSTQKINLEDGSTVTLSPRSQIIYPRTFASDQRNVQLAGDAFFEITKNPDKPFFVYSGKLITRVLGTSFRIKTNAKDQALEVEVVTGKVSVFENNNSFAENTAGQHSNGVILTPNQRVTYFPESRHLMTGLVVEPVKAIVAADDSRLVFNNIGMGQIVDALHKSYGIEIVFANDRLAECTFTGDITDLPLYEKLDLICGSVGADYEIKGTRILINGRGCD
ncbi:FecR family protein [Dyadobacter aurulentus]|uniref:FecR family protein n=1 Tax=Dyadobacter sp. UC 10 TaxID=2605428 RepID=UPI0011F39D0C|nr:FecR family protein [Dyadobacter sp. UC 10]KAA0990308.1 FecR family protein [Dyadobacter sp. UC 10]